MPQGIAMPPRAAHVCWLGQGAEGWLPPGALHLDGSAHEGERCTAIGWAVVALKTTSDELDVGISGVLNEPFVDINGGDLAAWLHLLKYAVPPVTAVAYSSHVIKGLTENWPARTTADGFAWADLRKQVWHLVEAFGGLGPDGLTVVKIASH
eukprot:3091129-Pyramimonas_sp.AAC.1